MEQWSSRRRDVYIPAHKDVGTARRRLRILPCLFLSSSGLSGGSSCLFFLYFQHSSTPFFQSADLSFLFLCSFFFQSALICEICGSFLIFSSLLFLFQSADLFRFVFQSADQSADAKYLTAWSRAMRGAAGSPVSCFRKRPSAE